MRTTHPVARTLSAREADNGQWWSWTGDIARAMPTGSIRMRAAAALEHLAGPPN